MSNFYDDGFKLFTQALEIRLDRAGTFEDEADLARHQRAQIRALVNKENEFRKTLLAHRSGPSIYREFVELICETKGNILSARPYFRERQAVFTEFISSALKKGSATGIYKYRINWSFVSWVLSVRNWRPSSPIRVLANEIFAMRKELLEENLPLAISQARAFYAATPRSHLTFMDVVQIQCQGLLLAIDKFCPPNEKGMTEEESLDAYRSFRAVAIGIMSRDRVNDYSQTLVHYYPGDRQIIYWANKMLRKFPEDVDHGIIAEEINKNLSGKKNLKKVSADEVADLLATASTVSADYSTEPDGDTVVESAFGDESLRPDVIAEQDSAHNSLMDAIPTLALVERKLLALKGIRA
jgi:DNA-directed RNA polymerase specialized sigma subunit